MIRRFNHFLGHFPAHTVFFHDPLDPLLKGTRHKHVKCTAERIQHELTASPEKDGVALLGRLVDYGL